MPRRWARRGLSPGDATDREEWVRHLVALQPARPRPASSTMRQPAVPTRPLWEGQPLRGGPQPAKGKLPIVARLDLQRERGRPGVPGASAVTTSSPLTIATGHPAGKQPMPEPAPDRQCTLPR